MIFDGTHKLIGKGAQADVFLYKGFAYKVYKPTYPAGKPVEEFSTVLDGFSLLSTAFKFVHKADITGLEIPRLTQTAGLAPALFDYAHTYVIFEEFFDAALVLYKALVLPDLKELSVSDSDFEEVVEVCRVLRQLEKN